MRTAKNPPATPTKRSRPAWPLALLALGIVALAALSVIGPAFGDPQPSPPSAAATTRPSQAPRLSAARATPAATSETTLLTGPGLAPPYPVPTSCAVTPLVGPEQRQDFPAYWLDGDRLAAGTPSGILFEGGNKVEWLTATSSRLTITGQRLDGPAAALTVRLIPLDTANPTVRNFGSIFSSEATFPAPGCWRLSATADDQTLVATVYVYPWSCRPLDLRSRTYRPASSAPCAAPTP